LEELEEKSILQFERVMYILFPYENFVPYKDQFNTFRKEIAPIIQFLTYKKMKLSVPSISL
jgi:hypothetical protein